MKTRTIFIASTMLMLTAVLHAQNKADPKVIASGGSHFLQNGIHLDYTMGEFMVQTLGTNTRFTQGFQQPGLEFGVGTIDPAFVGKITLLPNPAMDFIEIHIDGVGLFEVYLFNMLGEAFHKEVFIEKINIPIANLSAGAYALTITQNGHLVYSGIMEKVK